MTQNSLREDKLPDEIIDAHRTRANFLQWKLVIVAALGAAGLGLSKADAVDKTGLLALIPLVCAYVDLLCSNLNMRIILIGNHFAEHHGDAYERRARSYDRMGWFIFENYALYGSTYVACIVLFLFGFAKLYTFPKTEPSLQTIAVMAGCGIGSILTLFTQLRTRSIMKAATQFSANNETILSYLRRKYQAEDIEELRNYLTERGVFRFNCLENGLFPAIGEVGEDDKSGYQYAWVRDNVHIAYAHFVWGAQHTAFKTADALMIFFAAQRDKIRQIINEPSTANDPMRRPHIRFNAHTMETLPQKWAHAQNDALGYFIWFYCKTAMQRSSEIDDSSLETLALLTMYLRAIRYWEDKDSGHWEEIRKQSASSIGAVVAGLREMAAMCSAQGLYTRPALSRHGINAEFIDSLLFDGFNSLHKILPYESISAESKRRYDSALLFLIYPLEVTTSDQAIQILDDVKSALQGEVGIRRYLEDSYWFPNYRQFFKYGAGSADFSDSIKQRDSHIQIGKEAQWCIFDSIISCIHGVRALQGKKGEKPDQVRYLNRALCQLTPDLQCPEAYFYENGCLVPNDHVPLQWAQANLKMALYWLEQVSYANTTLHTDHIPKQPG